MILQFNKIEEITNTLPQLERILKSFFTQWETDDAEITKILQTIADIQNKVNDMHTNGEYQQEINILHEKLADLEVKMETSLSNKVNEMKAIINPLAIKVNGMTHATLMTQQDKDELTSHIDGVQTALQNALSSSHRQLLNVVSDAVDRVQAAKPRLRWVEVPNKILVPDGIYKCRYVISGNTVHKYTQKDTQMVELAAYYNMSDSEPEIDMYKLEIDGQTHPNDGSALVKLWKLEI